MSAEIFNVLNRIINKVRLYRQTEYNLQIITKFVEKSHLNKNMLTIKY